MDLVLSISNFFITKTPLANNWRRKKIPSCSYLALTLMNSILTGTFLHCILISNFTVFWNNNVLRFDTLFIWSKWIHWHINVCYWLENGVENYGFQWNGTVQLFGTKGQKFLHCPGTKGQQDKLKILPSDGTCWDNQNSGREGPR